MQLAARDSSQDPVVSVTSDTFDSLVINNDKAACIALRRTARQAMKHLVLCRFSFLRSFPVMVLAWPSVQVHRRVRTCIYLHP